MTTHFLPLLCTINQSNTHTHTHTHSLSLSLEHSKHTLLLPHKCLVGWCGKFQWLLSFFFLFGGVFCLECHPEFRYWANDAPILCVGVSKRKVANRRPIAAAKTKTANTKQQQQENNNELRHGLIGGARPSLQSALLVQKEKIS